MLAVVKKPHTKSTAFKLVGNIDRETLKYLNERFGKENVDLDDEIIDIAESEWFKTISKRITPGAVVRTYRENLNLTQQKLADKAGVHGSSYISDIENGRRPISIALVKKFSEIFGVSPEMFIP
jgi:DNA-binding XRE family transcriptional regulator